MRSVTISWQNALAAIVAAALVGVVFPSVRAGAEEKPRPDQPAATPKDEPAPERKAPAERREGAERKGPVERREGAERRIPAERRDAPDQPRREGEGRRDPEMDVRARELMENRERLMEKARDLERRLRELPKDRDPEAREIRENLERIGAELREVNAGLASLRRPEGERGPRPGAGREPEGPRPIPPEMRERLQRRLEQLKEKVAELERAGNREQAERLQQEIREIKQGLAGQPGMHAVGPPGPREEIERRMQHVRVAVENLHAAGLHDQAERVAREAEQAILRGARREGGEQPRGEPGMAPKPDQRPPHLPGPPQPFAGPEGVPPAIRELAAQVQDLRRQVQELREELQRSRGEGGPRR